MAGKIVTLTDKEIKTIINALEISGRSKLKSVQNTIAKLTKSHKSIQVASRKSKGRNLQRFICQQIADIFNMEFDQQNDSCLIHSREMGQSGTDIVLRGDMQKKFPYSIECKNQERVSFNDFIEQAQKNKKDKTDWMLILKNKVIHTPVVIMDWFVFRRLFEKGMLPEKK